MNNKFYTAILLLLPFFSIAQSNYQGGYVINTKGEASRAYVDDSERNKPKKKDLTTALNEKVQLTDLPDRKYVEISDKSRKLSFDGNNRERVTRDSTSGELEQFPKFKFFAGAALNLSTLNYSAGSPFPGSVPSKSNSPKIVLGVDAYFKHDIGSFIFRLEFAYYQNRFDFMENDNTDQVVYSQKIKQTTTAITPQFIYYVYNTAPLKLFVDIGYALNISTYPANETTQTTGSTSSSENNFPKINGSWYAFQAKAGVVINKRIELYGTYYPSTSITSYDNFSANLSSYQVGLNYLFR